VGGTKAAFLVPVIGRRRSITEIPQPWRSRNDALVLIVGERNEGMHDPRR
jgi:hypothetical protein